MLDERDIRTQCFNNTYRRAQDIVRNGIAIRDRYCSVGRYVTINCFVESSSGMTYGIDGYDVEVTFDDDSGEIISYGCTCPAHAKYSGMCKHAAALAMDFCRYPNFYEGYRSSRPAVSSPSISAFLSKSTPSMQTRASQPQTRLAPGSVGLELTLFYDSYGLAARFRICAGDTSYVIKNLGEFLVNVKRGSYFSYGKKLAFRHTPSLFDGQSRAVIGLLQEINDEQASAMRRFYGYHSNSFIVLKRDIDLSAQAAIKLLDLYADTPFLYDSGEYRRADAQPARVVPGNPTLPISITKLPQGGYEIERSQNIRIIRTQDRAYVIAGSTFYKCADDFIPAAEFLESVYCSWDERLTLSENDAARFSAKVLPVLEACLDVDVPADLTELIPEPCELEFYLDRAGKNCECKAVARYGEVSFNLLNPRESGRAARDDETESQAREVVLRYLPDITLEGNARTNDDETAGDLLYSGVAELRALGTVFTTPAFDRLYAVVKPQVQVGVSLVGNLINLQVKASELDPIDLAKLLASYQQRKHYHRLKDGSYLNLMGTAIEDIGLDDLARLANNLDLTAKQLQAGVAELPLGQAFLLDDEVLDAHKDEAFQDFVRAFKEAPKRKHAVPKPFQGVLRPYQKEGFRWLSLLSDMQLGGILADEMGLGKSVQVISWLYANRTALKDAPALIVCPASLVYNWGEEFAKFAPGMRVSMVSGTKDQREAARLMPHAEVLVTSYDSLRRDVDAWEQRHFLACILDEAQYIKNQTAQLTRAVKRMDADHRLALTGTPIENRLAELWSIFDFLMPGMLGSYKKFKERYELPIVGEDEEAARRLRCLVGPFILRRRKADVLKDLPEKLEEVFTCVMPDEQRKLYDAHEQQLRMKIDGESDQLLNQDKIAVLAEITKLRQICCDPRLLFENYRGEGAKMEAILQLVNQACESGQKVLVFSQFTSFLDLIARGLHEAGLPFFTITGATPKKRRVELVNLFNADSTPVFLISLKAGGTGLNLTGASVVIHADPWWNKAAQNQATDRAHRIGQKRAVSVYQVIAKDTIEERIMKLQAAKSELADAVLAADGKSLGMLSREELVSLLSEG